MENLEESVVEECLRKLAPSQKEETLRLKATSFIKSIIEPLLDDSVCVEFGSGPLKTYLPNSDVDITILYNEKLLKND